MEFYIAQGISVLTALTAIVVMHLVIFGSTLFAFIMIVIRRNDKNVSPSHF